MLALISFDGGGKIPAYAPFFITACSGIGGKSKFF
jgi:hypothetical protein